MNYKENKLYYIEWLDHCNDDGAWRSKVDIEPMLMSTVGWVVKDHKTYVVLAQSYYKDKDSRSTCAHMCIIKGDIKKSKKLVV